MKDVENQERKHGNLTYEDTIGFCLISGALALQCKRQESIRTFWKRKPQRFHSTPQNETYSFRRISFKSSKDRTFHPVFTYYQRN